MKMVRSDLLSDLHAAFQKAKQENAPARWNGAQVHFDHHARQIIVEVIPLASPDAEDRHFLILFEQIQSVLDEPTGGPEVGPVAHLKLRQEMRATREYLRAIIEQQETSNEELQSANEQLEIVKDELQSASAELSKLTEQQAGRTIELTQLNDDLRNVFEELGIPILLLDRDRRVRRFNRSAKKAFNLLPTDMGRPIQDLSPNLDLPGLQRLISRTLETLAPQKQEVRDLDGRYNAMSVRPYRTSDNKVEGVMIKLVDIDALKLSLLEAERARDYASAIVDTVREPLVVLDSTFVLVTANRSFCDYFQISPEQVGKHSIFEVAEGGWDNPDLRELLGKIRLGMNRHEDVRVNTVFPKIGRKTLLLNARRLEGKGDIPGMILLAMEDLTEREFTNESLRQSHDRLRDLTAGLLNAQDEERGRISRELHDDFNQRLAMVAVELENLEKTPFLQSAELPRTMVASLRKRTETISDDLRTLAHRLHPSVVEHLGLSAAMRSLCEDFRNQQHLRIKYRERGIDGLTTPPEIALCIYRVTQAALHNVARHSGSDRATVALTGRTGRILLSVSDNGAGFDLKLAREGKGLGILNMEERARLAVGAFTIRSNVGKGTRVAVEIPLLNAVLSEAAS
jgi:two-component system CheB/CheR fusion protein